MQVGMGESRLGGAMEQHEVDQPEDRDLTAPIECSIVVAVSGRTQVAFGPAGDVGSCSGAEDDFSSRDSITSPVIEIPGDDDRFAKLSFDHYVATEVGYDGGNVKISINGGAFAVIPPEAYVFNGPSTLESAATNTSPLAGQSGFTGTDGGSATGTWGTSHVDLAAAGTQPGDLVEFRFDIGRDGCGGIDGWYVDNVSVTTCKIATKVEATHRPSPVKVGKPSSVSIKVSRDGSAGRAPRGDVELVKANGAVVGTATLRGGRAVIPVPTNLKARTYTMRARYLGADQFASSSDKVKVEVVRHAAVRSTTRLSIRPGTLRPRQNFRVAVMVKAKRVARANGKVVLRIDGKRVGRASLKNGRVTIKVQKNFRPGKHTVVARYLGSKHVKASQGSAKFRVRRR